MDSQDHNNNAQHSPGGKSHVCSKCGWNYPNPHPSAKNRRAHKKVCGTIKGFEILGSDQNLDLQKEHCLDDDEQKTPSPRVVDERIGDVSEEDVFADAVCEFSSSLSIKEKEEETAANGMAKSATDLGETQHCNKSPEVVQESLDVLPPVQVLENFPSSVEADTGGESSSDSLIEQSRDAQVIHDGRTISNVGLETECKGNVADESESMVAASAIGKRVDTCASSWNDEVIYSDLEGPHGFSFDVEEMNMNPPGEADYTTVSDKNPVDTATTADQVINTSLSALDGIPFAENAHVSLHGNKALEEDKLPLEDLSIGREVPSPDKLPLEDKTEPHGHTSLVAVKESPSAENIVMPKIDPEDLKIKAESSFGASQETVESETVRTAGDPIIADSNADVIHSDLIASESELIQANIVAEENITVSELSSQSSCAVEHYVSPVSVISDGDEPSVQNNSLPETSKDSILQTGAEACESTEVDPIAAVSSADVSHLDLTAPESELVQANVVAEGNNTVSELSSQSSGAVEHYVSPVSVVSDRDEPSVQNSSSTETSKDSILQTGAEACESTEVDPIVAVSSADVSQSDLTAPESELIQANVVAEENSRISELSSQSSGAVEHFASPESVALEEDEPSLQNKSTTETSKDSILQIGAEACEITDKEDCTIPNQKLLESGRTEPNRVVGGLGVIQASEIDGNVKAHNTYAEVPVTIESSDHRDLGRLQNLSEAHIRSLVLSPLVTRDNTSDAISGHSEPENESQSSAVYVGQSKNQEITTSWSTAAKEQHVPLKNLLHEARSPRAVAEEATNIPKVSSILTSPEDEGGWPERREVSEEWNSPAKYPVERKVKGRPFWVPFVCCSSK